MAIWIGRPRWQIGREALGPEAIARHHPIRAGEDDALRSVAARSLEDVQREVDVERLDRCPGRSRARIAGKMDYRVDIGELPRPGFIVAAEIRGGHARIPVGIATEEAQVVCAAPREVRP